MNCFSVILNVFKCCCCCLHHLKFKYIIYILLIYKYIFSLVFLVAFLFRYVLCQFHIRNSVNVSSFSIVFGISNLQFTRSICATRQFVFVANCTLHSNDLRLCHLSWVHPIQVVQLPVNNFGINYKFEKYIIGISMFKYVFGPVLFSVRRTKHKSICSELCINATLWIKLYFMGVSWI